MTPLRPILGDDPTDDERRVLDSARLDAPSTAGRRRTLAAMGLAAAVTTTAGRGGAAATAAGVGVIAKWAALGAIGGTLALAATGSLAPLVRERAPRSSTVVAPRPASTSYGGKRATGASSGPPAPEVLPARADEHVPSPHAGEPVPRDPTPSVPPTAPLRSVARSAEPGRPAEPPLSPARPLRDPTTVLAPGDTLTAEVTALDGARSALDASDPGLALVSLDAYDRRFALRRLGPEASILRIEALMAEGRADQARQIGDKLLAAEPDGAYAQRVHSLLSGASR